MSFVQQRKLDAAGNEDVVVNAVGRTITRTIAAMEDSIFAFHVYMYLVNLENYRLYKCNYSSYIFYMYVKY